MSLYLSVLNKMLFNKEIHIHFISQNCRVKSKIKHSIHYNILADSGSFKRELPGVSTVNKFGNVGNYLRYETLSLYFKIT